MNAYKVQRLNFANKGTELSVEYELVVIEETYNKAIRLGVFNSLYHVRNIDEIKVENFGLWTYIVTENGVKSLWRIEEICDNVSYNS